MLCSVCAESQVCSMCGYNLPYTENKRNIPLYEVIVRASSYFLDENKLDIKIICGECLMSMKICEECQVYTDYTHINSKRKRVCDKCMLKDEQLDDMEYCYYCQKLYKPKDLIGGVCPDCI